MLLWQYITHNLAHSCLITGLLTRVTLMEQELPTLPEHMSSPSVCVTRSLVLCALCKSLFVLWSFVLWSLCCLFFFDIRILIRHWYLQTLLQSESRLDNGVISINLSRTFFTGIGHVLEYIDQVLKIHSF